jgi:hypothetical protein
MAARYWCNARELLLDVEDVAELVDEQLLRAS